MPYLLIQVFGREFPNGTPARIDRRAGVLQLAPSFFEKDAFQRDFIISHELGHWLLNTNSEPLADRYAADMLVCKYGLKKTFTAMNQSLHDTAENDIRRCLLFNYLSELDKKNKNMEMVVNEQVIGGDGIMRDILPVSFTDPNGFAFANDYCCDVPGEPLAPMEADEYLDYCGYYGLQVADPRSIDLYRSEKINWCNVSKKKQAKIDAMNASTALTKAATEGLKNGTLSAAEAATLASVAKDKNGSNKSIKSFLNNLASTKKTDEATGEETTDWGKIALMAAVVAGVVAIVVIARKRGVFSKKVKK